MGKIESFSDLNGKDIETPTKERFLLGDFDLVKVEENGRNVIKDVSPTPLHRAYSNGMLTHKQLEAGLWFERFFEFVYGGLASGRRDPLDMTPRGTAPDSNPTAVYLHYKDLMRKVEARIKLETLEEHEIRNKKLSPARKAQKPLLECGKWGVQRYNVVRSVCYDKASIGKVEKTRRRYILLCQGLDIIEDVVP
jgi:hypothetical protein